jgi:hypothetical protein
MTLARPSFADAKSVGGWVGHVFRYPLTPGSFSLRPVEQPLDTYQNSRRLNLKACRDVEERSERRAFVTPFQKANIRSMITALVCERLL